MAERETVITHLQIIHTWAEFARERDLQFFTAKHLEDIAQWSDDALNLLKAQRKVIRDLCTLGYPHNFQHEAPWVAQYCRDVSGVITEAFEVNDNDDT